MKKNMFLRVASVLLVLTLLSACAISGTFAKYTTSATATDTARVAYWGFTQEAWDTDLNLFDNNYTDVAGTGTANVVAPGTSKTTTVNFAYTDNTLGTDNADDDVIAPEVDYNFSITLNAAGNYTYLDANENFTWTLKMPGAAQATSYQTVAELKAAIEALNKDYKAGNLPTGFDAGNNTIEIGWDWAFYTSAEADVADTTMGNATALDDVTFTLTITATQNNTYPAAS